MFTVRKTLKFEMAHKLERGYTACCQHLHGHSYKIELFFRSQILNPDGMVVDFGKIKKMMEPLLVEWDHAVMLMNTKENLMLKGSEKNIIWSFENPTAENMARDVFRFIKTNSSFDERGMLQKVRVHETESGYAEYEEA